MIPQHVDHNGSGEVAGDLAAARTMIENSAFEEKDRPKELERYQYNRLSEEFYQANQRNDYEVMFDVLRRYEEADFEHMAPRFVAYCNTIDEMREWIEKERLVRPVQEQYHREMGRRNFLRAEELAATFDSLAGDFKDPQQSSVWRGEALRSGVLNLVKTAGTSKSEVAEANTQLDAYLDRFVAAGFGSVNEKSLVQFAVKYFMNTALLAAEESEKAKTDFPDPARVKEMLTNLANIAGLRVKQHSSAECTTPEDSRVVLNGSAKEVRKMIKDASLESMKDYKSFCRKIEQAFDVVIREEKKGEKGKGKKG